MMEGWTAEVLKNNAWQFFVWINKGSDGGTASNESFRHSVKS
jgi:hypothetical protein